MSGDEIVTREGPAGGRIAAAEWIEMRAMASMHEAAPRELQERLGMRLERIGGALVEITPGVPSILFNRAIGLGLEAPLSGGELDRIVERFRRNEVGGYYLHVHPEAAPDDLAGRLEGAALKRGRGWVKFLRDSAPPAERETELEVREVGPAEALDFGRIVSEGFELPDEAAPLLATVAGRPGWHLYLSCDGDTPAGAGLLYAEDGIGWLSYAATRPEFRARGSQGAIMARRIRKAAELGCTLLVTETGEEVEGQPQVSWRNIERAGFRAAYTRENWVPAG
jgi:hypothetical protein